MCDRRDRMTMSEIVYRIRSKASMLGFEVEVRMVPTHQWQLAGVDCMVTFVPDGTYAVVGWCHEGRHALLALLTLLESSSHIEHGDHRVDVLGMPAVIRVASDFDPLWSDSSRLVRRWRRD